MPRGAGCSGCGGPDVAAAAPDAKSVIFDGMVHQLPRECGGCSAATSLTSVIAKKGDHRLVGHPCHPRI
ncbi:hypothetical protein BBK14_24635 [Parafrankia soli]|uniref:Uncharacterized protein n=1 Tax=Parafrankia soli TaxID=2599596 RepID=A0A1S1PN66_9ACTN|nr:hypothetical protein BBK14_24635 [Parafrankia soli]